MIYRGKSSIVGAGLSVCSPYECLLVIHYKTIYKKQETAVKEVGSMRYQPRYGNGVQEVDQKPKRAEIHKKLAFDDIWAANLAVPEPIEACVHSLIKRVVWEFASSTAIR